MEKRPRGGVICHRLSPRDAQGATHDHGDRDSLEDKLPGIALAVVADNAFPPVSVEEFNLAFDGLQFLCTDTGVKQFGQKPKMEREV